MNDSLVVDITLHWCAVLLYVGATILNTYGVIFEKNKLERTGFFLVLLGLTVHSAALLYRWSVADHGPYISKYEVLSSNAWVALVLFLIFRRSFPRIKPSSIVIYPAVFLLIAIGLFLSPDIKKVPPTLNSIWLVVHVIFYKISLGTLIIALAFSFFYVLKKKTILRWTLKLPELSVMDSFAYRFAGFGFIFWAIAMLAGSIWAFQSWGRFWGWDPIESWSLVTWIFFGIYLHLRRFFGWQGEKAAWFFFLCFLMSLLALFFTPLIDSSIHSEYFK